MIAQWQTALHMANLAPRCGAKTRTPGQTPCQSPAMKNGRCRMHGGKSPGAPKGQKHGRFVHGLFTQEAKDKRVYVYSLIKQAKKLIAYLYEETTV